MSTKNIPKYFSHLKLLSNKTDQIGQLESLGLAKLYKEVSGRHAVSIDDVKIAQQRRLSVLWCHGGNRGRNLDV